ncbi:PhzF family phenazine biosynthesis protein [Paenibacillus endophyticus]|uniref:PhzF family phenazine biosynthesis protein n=1 Tax=Paenibacillus endophyticus TaxID=1294268 RepID=A0A7W5GAS9_9BACL|nr:PhzF family phenazine biosynthesis protein [Paenibacillus endophyticus]MBB3153055.1 PhzF family phenazine biosynthesis protein [Paenibacillus endophyticus]
MSFALYIVDAFTNERYKGNPAAICFVDEPQSESWMQRVAMEMNLSETAFVAPSEDGWRLRWFTPQEEVDLCGHATLATAHAMWQSGRLLQDETARFHTKSGILTASRNGEWIDMDFPSEHPIGTVAPEELVQGLGLIPRFVGRNRMDYFVEVDSEETVRTLRPDFALLARLDARGVIVTSKSEDSRYDFISRAFYPGTGVDEDPVTGSAHCALAPYWAKRLRKHELMGYQASARGGVVKVKPDGERVYMSGQAITVLKGQLEG